jgi:hypothetical protein
MRNIKFLIIITIIIIIILIFPVLFIFIVTLKKVFDFLFFHILALLNDNFNFLRNLLMENLSLFNYHYLGN